MLHQGLFGQLQQLQKCPEKVFEVYTTDKLWTDPYVSEQMLSLHLNPDAELASRKMSFIEESFQWISKRFLLNKKTKICDFGCGPGLYTSRFAKLGAKVVGIDFSENSIKYAKKIASENMLPIDYVLGDYLKFETELRFDLITMIYCDFCVLSPLQRKSLLGKFRELLTENGFLLLDVYRMQKFELAKNKLHLEYCEKEGFWAAEEYYSILNTKKYELEKVILDKWTILEKNRTREIFNWLQCFTCEELENEFALAGLEIVEYHGNVAGKTPTSTDEEIAVVARRKA